MMKKPKGNYFDLSHDVKMSFQMGKIVPTCLMDVVPGDRFDIQVENMLRFAALISPVMHRVNVTTHYYFVPNRILWNDWEDFITGEAETTHPYIQLTPTEELDVGSLGDYLGFPTGSIGTGTLEVNAFPLAAYIKVWNEYYRDQNLQTEINELNLGGGDNSTNYLAYLQGAPFNRAWMHDYFTSCLPFAQKGDAALLPLGTFSDVDVNLEVQPVPNAGMKVTDGAGSPITGTIYGPVGNEPAGGVFTHGDSGWGTTSPPTNAQNAYLDPNGNLKADTSSLEAQSADINTVRRAFRLQEWLEKNARGGTRYIESILSHFGIKSSDARLQRPEYIGGAFQTMTISEVLSTAQTLDDTNTVTNPVGQMSGHGVSYGGGQKFSYRAEEHGWIIGVINVQPVTAYQQGLHRSLFRSDKLDYFWPSFANIGEQAVLNKEVYVDTTDSTRAETFGYVPRYAEYKYMNSRVAGDFRGNLDFWHLGRKFSSQPVLNESFIECVPTSRIFAVEDLEIDQIYAHVYNKVGAFRLMPKFGVPAI